ncbi:MAG: hypothetical protein COZ06_11300 [Armatimonadetes bacterium CG_4_10_14_3_um_filter_66_18]|nr:radical SAM protein [Armatimonadota bacterium]PIU95620.1 MAG: hypothetical protein COS65_01430 [Armatimonadetes bacterium CG06_land_8_20_14_3_00_66_21]PIX44291.1 MAG: hypothetical protein COZ57_17810 [Armatimonadetes bacterium CG_4_8_14_3_um_filter_66_20]PIY50066.1 MAG: hypothetical protein COZ06_11300 [Armatimonadetes bacterium CG_4_10_14_3_um_filter_66_18]PIZ43401.1 MAG: hypothetical protein COY42_15940 [Armatimonadetes bacterium CG_4_10_14_0_8_um_filter_66_14]PJB61378.1 MAG: hypothetical
MISLSKVYCGALSGSDSLRYGHRHGRASSHLGMRPKSAAERRPVTVWNVTRGCNLRCIHCYTDSEARRYSGELTTEQGKALIDDLAQFGIPALLFSGGEPLMRDDLFELVAHATGQGVRPTLSTNGTLIDEAMARRIKDAGFTYVGISLDGIGEINDCFRGVEGAYERAMRGFQACKSVEQRVGLRLTLTRHNYRDLHNIFDFIQREGVDRACFYHLCYAGRGADIAQDDLTHEESREAVDILLQRTQDFAERGLDKEILTVDNHVDGVYAYLKLKEAADPRAQEVYDLLKWNGGGMFSSGVGIGDIDFLGNVHPDQFWMHHSLGNVKERPFSAIWTDPDEPLLKLLRNRRDNVKGRCHRCQFFEICGGAMRVRADAMYGDPMAPDPACYLTDEEIGVTDKDREEMKADGDYFHEDYWLTGNSNGGDAR